MKGANHEIEDSTPGWIFYSKNDPAENPRSKKSGWFFIELITGLIAMLFK